MNSELTLKLTKVEAQKVLDALIKEPYIEVVNLIDNIQKQAAVQIQKEKS